MLEGLWANTTNSLLLTAKSMNWGSLGHSAWYLAPGSGSLLFIPRLVPKINYPFHLSNFSFANFSGKTAQLRVPL